MCHAFAPVMSIMAFSAVSASSFPLRKQRLNGFRRDAGGCEGRERNVQVTAEGCDGGRKDIKTVLGVSRKGQKGTSVLSYRRAVDALTWDLNSVRSREGLRHLCHVDSSSPWGY